MMNQDGWPVLAESGAGHDQVQVCLYMGPRSKGQPVEAFRIQLGRPGNGFLFVTVEEMQALRECLASDAVGVTIDGTLTAGGVRR